MQRKICVVLLAAIAQMASGADYATNVWTADAGGDWGTTANWSDSSLVSSACYVDLSRVPDGGVVTTSSGRTIWGIIATNESETVKTITIKHTTTTSTALILLGPTGYKRTDFNLKNVRLVLQSPFVWQDDVSDNVTIFGSGSTVVFENTARNSNRWSPHNRVNFYVAGTDNYLEIATLRAAERMYLKCNANAGLRLTADAVIGELAVENGARGIWLNGHNMRLGGRSSDSTFSRDVFKDSGYVSSINGAKVAVSASQTGNVAFRGLEGQLTLSSSAVTSATVIESAGHGEIAFDGSASVATISSVDAGMTGAVKVPANAKLTVNGNGGTTSTVYRAKLTGAGGFVKRGGDYTLTLQGANDYQGATEVKEGSLVVSRPYASVATGLVADWKFDDENDIGHDSSGNGMALNLFNRSGISIVNDAERGKVVRLDKSQQAYLAVGMPNNKAFPTGDHAYTLSFWMKATAGDVGFDLLTFWGSAANLSGVICAIYYNAGMYVENRGNGKKFAQYVEGTSGQTRNFQDGNWHHIVQTYDSGTRRAYVDGVKMLDDTTGPLSVTSSILYLGWGGFGENYNYYDGCYDDFRVYDFALNEGEVANEFASGVKAERGTGRRFTEDYASKPIARYTFEDAENIGKDSMAGGADMTETSGTVTTVYDAERGGRVLDLSDASVGYLQLSTLPESFPFGDHNMAISCWVRPYDGTTANAENAAVFHYGNSTALAFASSVELTYQNDGSLRTLAFGAGAGWSYNPHAAIRNTTNNSRKWHHVVCVLNTGEDSQRLYVDGKLVKTDWFGSAMNFPSGGIFRLGNQPGSSAGFRGWVDDVRIYGGTLTADQVSRIIAEETAAANVLPSGTDVTVDAGATVKFAGVTESIGALGGSGTVKIADGSVLEVTSPSVFDGTLDAAGGWMRIGGEGSLRRTGGEAFSGNFVISEGLVVKVDSTASNLPVVKTTGCVTLPETLTVTLADGASVPPIGKYVLVDAGRLSVPEDTSGWTVSGGLADGKARLVVRDNKLLLHVKGGFVISFR